MLVDEVHVDLLGLDAIDELVPHPVVISAELTSLVDQIMNIRRREENHILGIGVFEARDERNRLVAPKSSVSTEESWFSSEESDFLMLNTHFVEEYCRDLHGSFVDGDQDV